jgi:hypothetical protein
MMSLTLDQGSTGPLKMQASTSWHTRQLVSIGGHWSCPYSPRPSYPPSGCRPYQLHLPQDPKRHILVDIRR